MNSMPIETYKILSARIKRNIIKAAFLLSIITPCITYASDKLAPQAMIGYLDRYQIKNGETLYDVARNFGVGIDELMYANQIIDPWFPAVGTELIIPSMHVLPSKPHKGIVINKTALRLYYFPKENSTEGVISFPIAIGKPGYETPMGTTRINDKKENPSWRPTDKVRAEYPGLGLPSVVPPGPSNPLGEYAIYLGWDLIVMHGTNDPWTVGSHVSRGCIRMYPEHIKTLFSKVSRGTEVRVVDEPVKIGWLDNQLYLTVYPNRAQKDKIDLRKRVDVPRDSAAIKKNLLNIAASHQIELDWNAVNTALQEYRSVPIRVSR